jgi:hypothetical protein
MPSFYETVRKLIPPSEIDHHESDLYVRDTPLARTIIRQFGQNSVSFQGTDGKRWIDVPFAYAPFWDKKRRSAHSTITSASPAKSKRVPKTRLIWVVQGNYGYGHGWEDLTAEGDRKEGLARLREYRENEAAPFRLIRRREQIGKTGAPVHARKKKISPHDAKRLLQSDDIDFRRDFHELSSSEVQRVLEIAALAGYRKRKDAPGSTARMYFQHLSRLK